MPLDKIRVKLSLIICLLFVSVNVTAEIENKELSQLKIQANEAEIWKDPAWLNLLHYQLDGGESNYLSQVDDSRFFNAVDGKKNPASEVTETLGAFYNSDITEPDKHAQCMFIARLSWLQKKLKTTFTQLPAVNCQKYNDWRKKVPAHKVTLIFPAYHLNSPSSMFGHTLLRIDAANSEKSSDWLSMAINFGASVNDEDNSLMFALKGLAGGYSGTFVVAPYYKKIKEYNRNENRDIWEYPLNLSAEETNRIVLHLWELQGIKFDYYFFDENCSYRLLELLQVARPELKLTNQYGLTAIPIDTVRSIHQANLITDIIYRPSQATNISYLLSLLESKQKILVLKVSEDADVVKTEEFQQLADEEKQIIIDAAYTYLRYKQNDDGRSEANATNSFKLLQAINKMSDFNSRKAAFTESQRPETGHFSKRIALTAGQDNDINYAQFEFRMAYHSLEDQLAGFLKGAQINVVNIAGRMTEDEVQLERLDVIDIFSLTPRNDFFTPLSWKVYTGLEQQIINSEDHLTGHVTAGAGLSYELWTDNLFYGLFTARLESNSQFDHALEGAIGLSTGLLQHFSFGTLHLEISGEEFQSDVYRHRVKLTQNIQLQRNHAIEFAALSQQQNDIDFAEVELSYHYFFH